MEGSLNKVVAYDNGFTVIACWGLSLYSHYDYAARAVFAAHNIQRKINRIGIPPLTAWVSSSFTLESALELYSWLLLEMKEAVRIFILEKAIERAFLLMQTFTRVYGKFLWTMRQKLKHPLFIEIRYQEHVEFANNFINHPIFEPLNSITISFKPIKTCKK